MYFNNFFLQILPISDPIKHSKAIPIIDRIMLVSEHKIYECEVGNAVGYYRSYNEDSFFEWECFAVEINK